MVTYLIKLPVTESEFLDLDYKIQPLDLMFMYYNQFIVL